MPFSILSDSPARRDLLNFDRYYGPLVDLITSETLQTPLTIGIFGPWGSGKSTLLGILANQLKEREGKFLCVEFNPWIFRKEDSLLIPLLHTLHDALKYGYKGKFKDSAARIADVLIHIGADIFLSQMTVGKVDLDKLDKYEKAYLTRKGLANNETRNLRETLRAQAASLRDSGVTIVLLIDDLDRCDPTEMIDLLEALKLFLDVENVVHVLAMDKEVVDRGVEVKYGKFSFGVERKASLGAEYLEKMIQIPVHLYPLHALQVKGFIRAHDLSEDTAQQIELLAGGLSPNPRKIKRVLNAVAMTRQALNGTEEADWSLVTALAILRTEQPELYTKVALLPKLLVALQHVYAKKWSSKSSRDFVADFGEKAEFVQGCCEQYYRPAGALAAIFALDFAKAEKRLEEYVSVVGGR